MATIAPTNFSFEGGQTLESMLLDAEQELAAAECPALAFAVGLARAVLSGRGCSIEVPAAREGFDPKDDVPCPKCGEPMRYHRGDDR